MLTGATATSQLQPPGETAKATIQLVQNSFKYLIWSRKENLHYTRKSCLSLVQEKEIFTSLSAARSLLEQKQHRPLLLVEDSALEDFTGTAL